MVGEGVGFARVGDGRGVEVGIAAGRRGEGENVISGVPAGRVISVTGMGLAVQAVINSTPVRKMPMGYFIRLTSSTRKASAPFTPSRLYQV